MQSWTFYIHVLELPAKSEYPWFYTYAQRYERRSHETQTAIQTNRTSYSFDSPFCTAFFGLRAGAGTFFNHSASTVTFSIFDF
jgi:hypothetical protein